MIKCGTGVGRGMPSHTPPLSDGEREELIERYEGIRVADAVDGLDFLGYGFDLNKMSPEISPLHRDPESFSHRIVGFANTVRFHPTNRRRRVPADPDVETPEGFAEAVEWRDDWYGQHHDEPGEDEIRDHDVIVVEAHEIQAGIIGSMNSLLWMSHGANGVVTNGGPRDTDEIIKQGVPMYAKTVNKGIIPGRCEVDALDVPVNVGGCLVRPGDVIVADGDGVVVVPIEIAADVAMAARHEQADDQETRRELYEAVGLEPDFTLE